MKEVSTIDQTVILENEKWFNFYKIFPGVVTAISAILFFIGGIVVSAVLEEGIFLLPFWLGGIIVCIIFYVCMKIAFSYKILHITYLRNLVLAKDGKDPVKEKPVKVEKMPTL